MKMNISKRYRVVHNSAEYLRAVKELPEGSVVFFYEKEGCVTMKNKGDDAKKILRKDAKKDLRFASRKLPELTEAERDVYALLKEGFMTPKKISIRRQTSLRAVQYHINNIKKKGYSWTSDFDTSQNRDYPTKYTKEIRLHGEHYVLNIIYKDREKYEPLRKKSNRRIIDNNTVELNRDSIEVYSGHSFCGESVDVADSRSLKYWVRFFTRLEYELSIILIKERKANISRVSAHYSETNNEFADKCLNESQRVRVVGEDGKVWLVVDNSFNLKELETVHPTHAKQDMRDAVKPFFNDLRQNPITLSHVTRTLETISSQLNSLTSVVSANAHTSQINAKSIQTLLSILTPQNGSMELKEDNIKEDYIG